MAAGATSVAGTASMELMEPGNEEVAEVHRQTSLDRVGCDVQCRADLFHENRRPVLSKQALVTGVVAALVQRAAVVEHILHKVVVGHAGEERALT